MALGGLAEGAFDWIGAMQRGQQLQQQQQYQQALMALNRQNQQLRAQEMLRQRATQAALGKAAQGLFGQGGGGPFGGAIPQQLNQEPFMQQVPQAPSYGPSGGMPQMSGGGGLPALQRQVLSLEGNQDYAVGQAGELGPGQIKPSTGAQYGYSPDQLYGQSGREASGRIVADLYRQSGGDPAATKVGYNAGPGAMRRFQAAGDNLAAVKLAPAYQKAVAADLSPEAQQQGSQAAVQTAGMLPPGAIGRYGPDIFARLVERVAGSDAPDDVKGAALTQLLPLMSREGQQQFAQAWEQYKFGAGQQEKQREFGIRQQEIEAGRAQTRELAEERMDIQRQSLADRQAKKAAGGGLETSKMFDVVNEKGEVVRPGIMARERRDQPGFIDSDTGQPIQLKPAEHLRQITATTSGGGRAGAQVLRQEIGGREVLSDLQNAVRLPIGTTIGPLGTVQPGTSIGEALKGDLVRKMTDQDSQLMQGSMASLTRELSILMSPVYGGNYAAQQIEPLVPKSGDTLGTVLFKLARLSQSADNALEAISKSPILSNEQQQYAKDLRGQLQEAIPWTPQQAMDFARGGDQSESFGDFVKRGGLGGGTGQGGGVPVPPSQTSDPDGTKYQGSDGKTYVKRGNQMVPQ